MNPEIQVQIRKVAKFSRFAKRFCQFLMWASGLLILFMALGILFATGSAGFNFDLGTFRINGMQTSTPALKGTLIALLIFSSAIFMLFLTRLYRLFDNFSEGRIFTKDTVLCIRWLGMLALWGAVAQVVLPPLALLLLHFGLIDEAKVTRVPWGIGAHSLPPFITAGLIILASWIMDIGRELRDENELVV